MSLVLFSSWAEISTDFGKKVWQYIPPVWYFALGEAAIGETRGGDLAEKADKIFDSVQFFCLSNACLGS